MATEAWFEVAPDDVQAQVRTLIDEHYRHTYSEQRVTALFRHAACDDKGKSQDWHEGGCRTLGRWAKVPERFKCLMDPAPDVVILLNFEAWDEELTEAQKTALLDHELYHGVQRAHDIGEFTAILARRGDYLDHIAVALPANGDLPLTDAETGAPVEHDPARAEMARAAGRLNRRLLQSVRKPCPEEGGGITSVELSVPGSGEPPAVLTADTREKIDRMLAEDGA